MFTKVFWRATAERAVKAFSYSALGLMSADGPLNIVSLNWGDILGTSATVAVISVLGSIVSGALPVGPEGSPSLVNDGTGAPHVER